MNSMSYERAVAFYNRKTPPAPRTTCECGKEIFSAQLDKHRRTMFHRTMMLRQHHAKQGVDDDFLIAIPRPNGTFERVLP